MLAAFRLSAPVFGGTGPRRLAIRYRLARAARVRVDVLRGRTVVRRLGKSRRVAAGRTRRATLRPRGLPRATYRVRLTIRRAGAKPRRVTLAARRRHGAWRRTGRPRP